MATLKDLQEMVINGEFSKKLLEDEKFKTEIKKILKEENGIEITDEDIPEVIKNLAENLKETPGAAKVKQVLSEEEVENVSGGVSKAKIIKGVSAVVGYILGAKTSKKYMSKLDSEDLKAYKEIRKTIDSNQKLTPEDRISLHKQLIEESVNEHPLIVLESFGKDVGAIATGAATSYGSYKLADYLCKKFNIK